MDRLLELQYPGDESSLDCDIWRERVERRHTDFTSAVLRTCLAEEVGWVSTTGRRICGRKQYTVDAGSPVLSGLAD